MSIKKKFFSKRNDKNTVVICLAMEVGVAPTSPGLKPSILLLNYSTFVCFFLKNIKNKILNSVYLLFLHQANLYFEEINFVFVKN